MAARFRPLDAIVTLRRGEGTTAVLMFAYSFLAMTSYNIVRPVTKSKFIDALGADNIPYVELAAFAIIGLLMQAHGRASRRLFRTTIIPATQAGLLVILLGFWFLFTAGVAWAPVGFYVFGRLFGILLISQFWTLANDLYDARQARRLFGFIGGGASLGGMLGGAILATAVQTVGSTNLLLVSAVALAACMGIVVVVSRRQTAAVPATGPASAGAGDAGGASQLLRRSRHLKVVAGVVGFAALGATLIDYQLNLAAEANLTSEGAIAAFLGWVTVYLSGIGFVVQIGLVSRIHRSLGLSFALLLLPVSLGATAVVILVSAALWAPAAARVLDTSLRYTIDKTSREVLFLPLPADVKYRAKPFVDVTVDRFAKAVGGILFLLLVKPWGLGLDWVTVSYASLALMGLWVLVALVARHEYLRTFRRSLGARDLDPANERFDVAEASTIQALVDELSSPDENAVRYAIDMLETLDERDRITPLLLSHPSPRVRARALVAFADSPGRADAWQPAVRRLLADPDPGVRAAAVRASAALERGGGGPSLRAHLDDAEPMVVVAAAAELADAGDADDASAAEAALTRLVTDERPEAAPARKAAAAALARVRNPACRSLLVPLIHDADVEVAAAAIASARALRSPDALFLPALVSQLGHRVLKTTARDALVGYGEEATDFLAHVLKDRAEYVWVRRHVPATLARIPGQRSLEALVAALDEPDGFLRYKLIEAIGTLRRSHPDLSLEPAVIERLATQETGRYYTYLSLRYNLVGETSGDGSLLVAALDDKLERTLDRVFRLLGLRYPWKDVEAAERAIAHGDTRERASGLEYLDNLLAAPLRRRVMPILDDAPLEERVRHANSVLKSRPRDVTDTLAQLIHEDDVVVAAAAVHFAQRRGLVDVLADDLAFVAARRTADPVAHAAATWALPHGERPGDRAWADAPLPVVELADRLRAIPLFGFVSVDELFRVARAAVQVAHPSGAVLFRQGDPASDVLFLLEGAVAITGGDPSPSVVRAPAALNFADMLEGRPLRYAVTASEPVVGLTLDASAFLTMLSDNIQTARGLFRMLLASRRAVDEAPAPAALPAHDAGLDPVETAGLLRRNPLFGHATIDQLKDLVSVTRDVTLDTGDVLLGRDTAPAMFYILQGEIRTDAGGASDGVVGPGGTVGLVEVLTGDAPRTEAVVTRRGRALRLDHEPLFDVLADHGDLLQGVFGGVLGVTAVDIRTGRPVTDGGDR